MSWGIADTALYIEKIKAESADYLNGLNSCGVIDYSTYSNAFDFYADLLDKAYEQGQKDAERKTGRWIPCSERLPEDETKYYLVTVVNHGLFFTTGSTYSVKIVRWDYDRRKGRDSWHWCTERTVVAWMPLPEPYKEVKHEKT